MASEQDIIQLYNPPRECQHGRCDNLFMEFIYCVVIPAVVVILLLVLLAIIMLCNSKSCKCKKYSSLSTQTNDIQMEDYNSIRRASANLRLMSHNRETPIMGSRASSTTLDRTPRRPYRPRDSSSSAPGTLQRQIRNRQLDQTSAVAPPPYSVDLEESFIRQQRLVPPSGGDALSPPPPQPYKTQSGNVSLGAEFLESSMQAGARFDESPEHNGSGLQPLLFHRSYDA